MSSRIYDDDGGKVQQVAWRKAHQPEQVTSGVYSTAEVAAVENTALQERLARLEREAEMRERQAHESGIQAGESKASQRTAQQVEQMMGRVAQSVQEMVAMRHQMRRQMEEDLVHLSIVVARRILHRELNVDPEALTGIVKAAVAKIELREINRIRLSSADAPVLENLLARLSLPERVELVRDAALERGSVIVETTRGMLDSSVSTQLEEIERGFVDLVRRAT
ncbi:MAG: hypothetical protein FJW20_19810 [Acidimicrobiia bacterium]|nr:hypothetical protein [Acidimicrobiia bacterium]